MLLDSQASGVPTLLDASLKIIKEIEGTEEEDSVFIDQEEVHEYKNDNSSNKNLKKLNIKQLMINLNHSEGSK
jgi:hypothetical protein